MAEPEAGRELDALVAERVMGLKVIYRRVLESWNYDATAGVITTPNEIMVPCEHKLGACIAYAEPDMRGSESYLLPAVRRYSTDIASAWLVVEKMCEDKWALRLHNGPYDGIYYAEFSAPSVEHEAYADTAPLAICRAALLAVDAWRRNGGA